SKFALNSRNVGQQQPQQSAGSSRRREIRQLSGEGLVVASVDLLRPSPFGPEQLTNVGQFQMTSELPSGVRNFLGERAGHHDAGAAQLVLRAGWEQKYLRDMGRHDPRRNLEFDFADSPVQGTPRCRYCGVEFGSASLLTHQAKWRRPTNDTARGTEPGYLIRNWYSRNHPLKRLEKNRHVKECRYCHSAVPWHALSQHEDECRSIMYGTTPTSGYY
uniref:C2H2-type domain-containing protein n=1 Tax=Macrostomum lignano TaxID=282301 RepID=A0A1I8FSU5_9PLAT